MKLSDLLLKLLVQAVLAGQNRRSGGFEFNNKRTILINESKYDRQSHFDACVVL
ncbi:MAG: hypothetical protein AB2697_17435 [Candidatus Thiodiazotropha endolucinida]